MSGPRPKRCFHQTALAALPRKRSFFTSNQMLSNGERNDHGHSPPNAADDAAPDVEATAKVYTPVRPRPLPARPPASTKIRGTPKAKKKQKATVKKTTAVDVPEETEADYERRITAICVAQSFDMERVEEILTLHNYDIDPDSAGLSTNTVIHARAAKGDIFVFDSGTVVGWAVPAHVILGVATKQLVRAADVPHVSRLEMEELEFSYDDTRDTSYMRGEEVVLGTKAADPNDGFMADLTWAKAAFSSGLARSPKIAVLENQMEEFHENVRPVASRLKGGSEMNKSRQFILKRTGELLSLRSQLNEYELAESLPDLFWDKESKLEQYYDRVGKVLDVEPRIDKLNKRIDYANELVAVAREMSSEKLGHRLEWIIIILIAMEIAFELDDRGFPGWLPEKRRARESEGDD